MTETAGGPGAPELLADGAVLAWKSPDGIRLQLRRQVFSSGRTAALVLAVAWGGFLFTNLAHRLPAALLGWVFYAWISPSLVIFLWVLALSLRRATFEADAHGVRVILSGLFGRRVQSWKQCEMKDIREEASRTYGNDEPDHELVFEFVDGRRVRMLGGMTWRSLNAVAAELRMALGLALRKPQSPEPASS